MLDLCQLQQITNILFLISLIMWLTPAHKGLSTKEQQTQHTLPFVKIGPGTTYMTQAESASVSCMAATFN